MRRSLTFTDETLIQQSKILSFPGPEEGVLRSLQNWLHTREGGALSFIGPDAGTWGSILNRKGHPPDLVSLSPHRQERESPVFNWMVKKFISGLLRFNCIRFPRSQNRFDFVGFTDKAIYRTTYWVISLLTSLLPILSILILYWIRSMPARLGIVVGFNALISILLNTFTTAKRAEIITITAAYV